MANLTSTSSTGLPDWLQPYATSYLNRAQQTADQPYQGYTGQMVADQNPYMAAGLNAQAQRAMGGSADMNAGSQLLQKTLGGGFVGANPYLDAQVSQAQGDVVKQWNNVQKPQWDTAMGRSGSFGNSGVMQAGTRPPFMRVLARRGSPDWFVTEYFRVHPESRPDRRLLRALFAPPLGVPVCCQMIGDDLASLTRTARELAAYPTAGIDLNLGCPAPIVCRKNAGGGLLRHPDRLKRLLDGLRAAIPGCFTVKTRLGYAEPDEFAALLEIFRHSGLDGLTIHARTVKQGYQGAVATAWVREAVRQMPCPVVANGNIVDVTTARACHQQTGAAGLMVGRGAIRNPWIFAQLRAAWQATEPPAPSHRDLLAYLLELYDETALETPRFCPSGHVQRMKRTAVYVCHGLGTGFEYTLRRCRTPDEFREICHRYLDHDTALPAQPPADSTLFNGFTGLLADNGPPGPPEGGPQPVRRF